MPFAAKTLRALANGLAASVTELDIVMALLVVEEKTTSDGKDFGGERYPLFCETLYPTKSHAKGLNCRVVAVAPLLACTKLMKQPIERDPDPAQWAKARRCP